MTLRWLLALPSLYRGFDYYRHTRDHTFPRVIAPDYSKLGPEQPGVFRPMFDKGMMEDPRYNCEYCAERSERYFPVKSQAYHHHTKRPLLMPRRPRS